MRTLLLNRALPLAMAAFALAAIAILALTLFLGAPAVAAEKNHEGKVVSAGDGKLVMTEKDGTEKTTHKVSSNATITLDGKKTKLSELKDGQFVKVWYSDDKDKTATRIEARTKEKK